MTTLVLILGGMGEECATHTPLPSPLFPPYNAVIPQRNAVKQGICRYGVKKLTFALKEKLIASVNPEWRFLNEEVL